MDWNDEAIARLRMLWDEGHSTAEIGRRLGVTKNAVVGKSHRLNLPPRPSPIRRGSEGQAPRRPQPRRVTGPTLPQLAPAPRPTPVPLPVVRPTPTLSPTLSPVLRAVSTPRPGGRVMTCCWPIGEPGTPSFHFCDDGAMHGKPYCEAHAALAYVKVRDRREDAA